MKVTVYTEPDSVACELTLRSFGRRSIEVEEVPLTEELAREFRSKGYLSAPIVVTPDLWWYGLKPDLIHETWKAIERDRMGGPHSDGGARSVGTEA